MSNSQLHEEIKDFLVSFPYRILHEQDKNHEYEYYFVAISLNDREKVVSNSLNEQFVNYVKEYPLNNISSQSVNYIKNNKNNYHFLYIDKVSLNDPLFKIKEHFIKENANNILSKRMIGQAADPALDLTNKIENYALNIKEASTTIGTFAKLKLKEQLVKGKASLEEKGPNIKTKISNVFKRIKP
jgi:hypothetical protein